MNFTRSFEVRATVAEVGEFHSGSTSLVALTG